MTVKTTLTRLAPMTDDKNTMHCAFCRKSQHDVKKLIAGPGVFICDECVALCQGIIAESPDPKPGDPPAKVTWGESFPTDRLLTILRGQNMVYADVRDRLQDSVDVLRKREVSWAEIGAALGVSRQAAWERFS